MLQVASTFKDWRNACVIISGSLLSTLLAFESSVQGYAAALITLAAAFACYLYLCRQTAYAQTYFQFRSTAVDWLTVIFSLYTLYILSGINLASGVGTLLLLRVFHGNLPMMISGLVVLSVVLFPAVYTAFHWMLYAIIRLLKHVFGCATRYEKTISVVFMMAVLLMLLIAYTQTSVFSNCYFLNAQGETTSRWVDALLDTDSPNVLHFMFDLTDINARHIFAKLLLLPVTIPARLLSLPFVAREQVFAFLLCLASALELLITALLAARLSKARFLLPLLLCSYPFLLFSLVFERNQLAVFLIVLAVHENIGDGEPRMGEAGRLATLGIATGATTTSGLIGLFFFQKMSLRAYAKHILRASAAILGTLVLAGKTRLFFMLDEAVESVMEHSDLTISLWKRVLHYTESVQSMLIPSKTYTETILQPDGTTIQVLYNTVNKMEFTLSLIGVAVIALAVIGFLAHRGDAFARVSMGWIACHVLIFPVLGFSSSTYLLHALMFSWAYLGLAYRGVRWCLRAVPPKLLGVLQYGMIAAMAAVNIRFLYQLYQFGVANYPLICA